MILSEQEIFRRVSAGEMTKLEALEYLMQLNSRKAVEEESAASQAAAGGPLVGESPSTRHGNTADNANNTESFDQDSASEAITHIVSDILHIPLDEINLELSFKDLGVDSISGVEIVRDVNKTFNLNMDAVVLYDYPTIPELASHVNELAAKAGQTVQSPGSESSTDIYHDPYYLKLRQKYIQKEYQKEYQNKYSPEKASDKENQPVKVKLDLKNAASSSRLDDIQEQPDVSNKPVSAPVSSLMDEQAVGQKIAEIVGEILHMPIEDLSLELSFKDLGVDSISGIEIVRDVNKEFNLNMDSVVLYDYSNILELAAHVSGQMEQTDMALTHDEPKGEPGDVYHDPYYLKLRQKYLQKEHGTKELGAKELGYLEPTSKEPGSKEPAVLPLLKLKNSAVSSPVSEEAPFKDAKPLKLKSREEAEKDIIPENKQDKQEKAYSQTAQPDLLQQNQISVLNVKNNTVEGAAKKTAEHSGIAIIGMSGRFPNSENLKKYWNNLRDGVDCIIEIPNERWDIDKYYDPDPKAPGKTYSRWFGMIPDADRFDPMFFNISPIEAETMDPQQRIFLEEAWKALEDAGYSDKALSNFKCGVFVGTAHSDYQQIVDGAKVKNITDTFTGLSPSILPARISYFMNLLGPSIALDTACSSSLVAIHEACQSILAGDCEMALAGGVRLMLTPDLQIQTSKAGMMSPTGKCRAFDQDADGIVMGEGVGVVVLKPLQKAMEDGDNIYGIIKSSGVNQDGRTNGITAPSAQSQAALEHEVYKKGGINPEDITLVEAHGTGTKLGDPIEVKALKEAFGRYTKKRNYCAISSVKANIGHTTMAAGIASVIKVLLAIKHKQIPPMINFKNINEHIDIENSPFYINTRLKEWDTEAGKPRLATVSSFGFSGTNCHIVIQEPPGL